MKRITELDGLRAIAVAIVVCDHYAPFRSFAHGVSARYGGTGVDIFFVLSGFLITGILLKAKTEPHPYLTFYARRNIRILPPLLLVTCCVYAAGYALGEPVNKKLLLAHLLFLRSFKGGGATLLHMLQVVRTHSLSPGLFHRSAPSAIPRDYARLPMADSLGPTWSLSVEEWFYLLWAPIVVMSSRRIIASIAAAACLWGLVIRWKVGGTGFFTSVDILAVGALLALWIEQRMQISCTMRRVLDSLIATVSATTSVLVILLWTFHRDALARTLVAFSVFGLIAWLVKSAGSRSPVAVMLRARPLVYLGGISYTFYLAHLPIYFLVRKLFDSFGRSVAAPQRTWCVALCSIAMTLAFAAASWTFYEQPLLKRKDTLAALFKRRFLQKDEPSPGPAATADA
jgi:peptidoglycan/LPS O-acetylase OafA/YrhL